MPVSYDFDYDFTMMYTVEWIEQPLLKDDNLNARSQGKMENKW